MQHFEVTVQPDEIARADTRLSLTIALRMGTLATTTENRLFFSFLAVEFLVQFRQHVH